MKKTILLLRVAFLLPMAVCLVLIALFESGALLPGGRAGLYVEEFYVLSAMELLAIIAVPTALYMFRIGAVRRRLVAGRENALLRLGLVRILMMALPMMADTLLYYIYMLPSLGYLAIILFLSLFFVYPSKERCVGDITE